MSKLMKVKLKDIKPNPYRILSMNPLQPKKVAALVTTINHTYFWTGITARINKQGEVEIAFGHHRIEAAKVAGLTEATLIIEDLDDSQMLKMMTDENSEDYKYNVLSVLESVVSTVKAYAAGIIELEKPAKDVNERYIRYAPRFTPGAPAPEPGARPYTNDSIIEYLGTSKHTTAAALSALWLIEITAVSKHPITAQDFDGLNNTQFQKKTADLKDAHEYELRKQQNFIDKQLAMSERAQKMREQAEKEAATIKQRLQDEEEAAERVRLRKLAAAANVKAKEAAVEHKEAVQAVEHAQETKHAVIENLATQAHEDRHGVVPTDTPKQKPVYKGDSKEATAESVHKRARSAIKLLSEFLSGNDTVSFDLKEVKVRKKLVAEEVKAELLKALDKLQERLKSKKEELC